MKNAPLILIAPGTQKRGAEFYDYAVNLSDAYPQAIIAAGGLPWILPCAPAPELVAECVRRCDGVLMTGGDDIQPRLYTAQLPRRLQRTLGPPDPKRDLLELLLIQEVFRRRKPLLAICRGHQMLNVALGGTLLVDINLQAPGALRHCRMDRKDRMVHEVALAPDSRLARVFGQERIGVNSTHHQAVARVARPFRATAVSQDGIVEGLELNLADGQLLPYLLAVQFHPERLIERHPEFRELFRDFTRACRSGRRKTT
ncbi:MAG: gamma-glutamyl-gamma-aminobutyrate hydrolase family protein [Chloroflexi bacterium]|nr:gamma-glutamyl-gamma-aminobutyrate hydrolase family protein [Chloroflexota bacterium]